MATVILDDEELEILIDSLPPSYSEGTPKAVRNLKIKLMNIQDIENATEN